MARIFLPAVPTKNSSIPEEAPGSDGKLGEAAQDFDRQGSVCRGTLAPSQATCSLPAGTPWAGRGCEAGGGCTALGPTMPCTPLLPGEHVGTDGFCSWTGLGLAGKRRHKASSERLVPTKATAALPLGTCDSALGRWEPSLAAA